MLSPAQKNNFKDFSLSKFYLRASYILIAILIVTFIIFSFLGKSFPIRLIYDYHDIQVYFKSTNWIVGEGKLYLDVQSEYPFLANILFAFCRLISLPLSIFINSFTSFSITWCLLSLLAWRICFKAIHPFVDNDISKSIAWCLPALIYFSLNRYDIYPALFVILCFSSISRKKIYLGALYLGIAIALKGYGLFMMPSLVYYLYKNYGKGKALKFTLVALSPFALGNIIVLISLGPLAFLSSYEFHAYRTFNGQSTWDTFGLQSIVTSFHLAPTLCTALASIAGYLRKPRTLHDCADSCLLSVVGFVSSTVFYSPQFCLWFLSLSSFSKNKIVILLTTTLAFVAYLYFPVGYGVWHQDEANFIYTIFYGFFIHLTTILRIAIIAIIAIQPRITLAPPRFQN